MVDGTTVALLCSGGASGPAPAPRHVCPGLKQRLLSRPRPRRTPRERWPLRLGLGNPQRRVGPRGGRLRWPAGFVSAPHLNGYDTFTGLRRNPAPPQAAAGELSEEIEHPPLLPRARYLGRATGRRTE